MLGGVLANVFSDSHRAKMGPTHTAEVCSLRAFLRKRLIMKFPGCVWIQSQVKLVLPTELKPGFRNGIVAVLRAGMTFGQVGGVRGNFVSDDAVFDVFLV